jgi:hypothetical protein
VKGRDRLLPRSQQRAVSQVIAARERSFLETFAAGQRHRPSIGRAKLEVTPFHAPVRQFLFFGKNARRTFQRDGFRALGARSAASKEH